MRRITPLPLLVACLALALCHHPATSSAAPPAENHRPVNVVLILVDDMGYGDPACFNPESKIATPNIDRLAEEGMRFTDAHAPGPLCHLSRYGLMTGRYPFRANCGAWREKPTIAEGRVTVPSLLKDNGYRTAMVGKWHLGFAENGYENPLPGGPVDRGFDTFFGIRASTDIPPYFYIRNRRAVEPPTEDIAANRSEGWTPIQGAFWRAGKIAPNLKLDKVLPRFTNEAIDVIEKHAASGDSKPLMLYLAYPSPHTPWLPSERFRGKSGAGMYGDFLMMVDTEIGRVLSTLDKAGMKQDTMVIFSSDNGPVWYDQDTKRFGHDSTGGLRGMKADAWEAGHRMPFLVRWPGRVTPGSKSDQTICFTDLLATFAEMLDVQRAADDGPDSVSFLPVLLGTQPEDRPVREHLVIRSGSGLMTIRRGPWKLITGLGSGGFSKPRRVKPKPGEAPMQLYHLGRDPGEATNVYAEHPEIVAELKEALKRIQKQ